MKRKQHTPNEIIRKLREARPSSGRGHGVVGNEDDAARPRVRFAPGLRLCLAGFSLGEVARDRAAGPDSPRPSGCCCEGAGSLLRGAGALALGPCCLLGCRRLRSLSTPE
jgi:hypothetical protein